MGVATADDQTKMLSLLVEQGLATSECLDKSVQKARELGKPIFTYLSEEKIVSEEAFAHAGSVMHGVPYINLLSANIEQKYLTELSSDVAERFMSVPIGEIDGRLAVAMLDSSNVQAVDYLTNLLHKPLRVYNASETGIRHVLDQYHADLSSVNKAAEASEKDSSEADSSEGDIKTIVQDSPISRALNTILEYAVKSKASDIHIEPLESGLKIRCRVDGVLREVMQLPKTIEPALVSRIKILSNLKIDEHRIPQDGQFAVNVNNKEVDLRIAISPVVWGEQVVIRLLDKSGNTFDLEQMGYAGRALRAIRKGIKRPNGMILTSGPTGSGKSTSLYALIKEIKDDSINIVTLEDPVEYKMNGVNQIQVNNDVGLTFASGLRSILRQDPDVVMVGEMRDKETANLGIQAALTGHLVLSTLHTNSAAGVLPRFLDMKIEPFLIASTVNTVIGQRLVRRVARKRKAYWSNPLETKTILETVGHLLPKSKEDMARVAEELGYKNLPVYGQKSYVLVRGEDTPATPRGYSGRAGLYEVMDINEEIQALITQRATTAQIQRKAVEQGMITMREDGYLKALQGITTIEEVNRVTSDIA